MKKLIPVLLMLAASSTTLANDITYTKHIRPLWEDKCERCHGASAPVYSAFLKDRKAYELDDKGPRMESYESFTYFITGPQAGALMNRLDDGSNTKDGQPGNMYRHLGRGEERKANLQLIKQWIGENAWVLKKPDEISKDDLQRIQARN